MTCRPVAEHGEEDGGYHLDTSNAGLSKVFGSTSSFGNSVSGVVGRCGEW